jgi:choline dehydrogenase-like flavoprotein
MDRLRSEVVVIGSGAGGATVAGGLASAGVRVTVIEAGAQRGSPPGAHVRNLDPRESGIDAYGEAINQHLVYPSEGKRAIPGLTGFKVAHGVGGMLAFWTNNCPRPHPAELPNWIATAEWDRYLDRAYDLLGISANVFMRGVRMRRLLQRTREVVGPLPAGREVQPMPVAARWVDGRLHFAGAVELLGGYRVPKTLTLRPDLVAHAVLHDGRRATAVTAHARAGGTSITIEADTIVVAAGTIGTPKLLVASDIDAGPTLGRGIFDHPAFASRVALAPDLSDAIPEDDPPFSIWVPYSPEHPWHNQVCRFPVNPSPLLVDAPASRTADLFTWIPMDIDPENRLIFDRAHQDSFGLPEVRAVIRLSDATLRRAEDGLAEHFRIATALGDLGNGWYPTFLKPGESTHLMGSCHMGPRDDGTSVIDSHGRLWRYDNLYVAGNAVLARANAGNPSLVSIACALRTVNHLLGNVG